MPESKPSPSDLGFELKYAVEQGYVIDRFYACQIYRKTAPVLRPWAQWAWETRLHYEKQGSPMASLIKNLSNALVGTFSMDGYTEHLVRHPKPEELKPCPCRGMRTTACPCRGRCCDGCQGECGMLAEWSRELGIWIRRSFHPLDRAHAPWGIWTISWTRVKTHRKGMEGGGRDLISIATDGFRCEGERLVLPVALKPGDFRLHKELRRLHSPGGNTSTAEDVATGEPVVRASGIPRAIPGGGRVSDREIASRITADRMFVEARETEGQVALDDRRERLRISRAVGLAEGLAAGKSWAMRTEETMPARMTDQRGRRWFSGRILDPGATVTRAPTIDELNEL